VPTAQGEQLDDPAAAEKVLGGQSWHWPPAEEKEPGAHASQRAGLGCRERECAVPAGQLEQTIVPVEFEKVDGPHGEQAIDPGVEKVPIGQAVHDPSARAGDGGKGWVRSEEGG
jgi:hypothetical protein